MANYYGSSPGPRRGNAEGWFRLLLVDGAVAFAVWFGLPYLKGELSHIASQLSRMGNHAGFEPPFDPFGLRSNRGEDDYAADPRRPLRLPPDVGNARGEAPA